MSSQVMRLFHKSYQLFKHDSLYRNSIILILDTAMIGMAGFIFWIIGARLYTQNQLGLTVTLVAAASLLASISQLGFDNTFTRYLGKHVNPRSLYETGVSVVALAAIVLGAGFVLVYPHFSPGLRFLSDNLFQSGLFIFFVVATALNALTNAVFLAFRKAQHTLYANISLIAAKLLLPWILIGFSGLGLYLSFVVGTAGGALTSFWLIWKHQELLPRLNIEKQEVAKVAGYSIGTYAGNLLQNTPQLVLPLIVTAELGAQQSAIFYLAMMACNLINIIPVSAASSVFAEGSSDEASIYQHLKKAATLVAIILTPILALVLIFSGMVMQIFGKNYGVSADHVLQLLALSSIFLAVSNLTTAAMKVLGQTKTIVAINTIGTTVILGSIILFAHDGLIAIAALWTAGQAFLGLMFLVVLALRLRPKNAPAQTTLASNV
jgi:O-antigen/teichoic acid export membrane protein